MCRRSALAGLVVPVLLPVFGCGSSHEGFANAPVVLISIDTLRSDHLPAYGYRDGATPHLDRLRTDAVLFKNAWSPCPMTLPSHVTMLTGLNPPAHGVRNNAGFLFSSEAHPSLPALLRTRGYASGAAVSSYVLRGETGLAAAFDWYEDSIEPRSGAAFAEHQRPGDRTAALAKGWMAAHAARPFFFFLHLYEPHVPYDPPEPYRGRFAHPYDGEIAAADAIVGDVLDQLRAAGLYERAIVIVTSDHGEGLGDHGEEQHSILLYREALQVPLLLKLPGSRRGGEVVDAPVQLADLLPTLAELLEVPKPPNLDGRSLLSPLPARRALYAETLYPRLQLGWSELRSIVDGRYHLIEGPRPELYDLTADAAERHDLAARQAAVAERLQSALRRVPEGGRTPREVRPDVLARLAALGYLGTPREPGAGPLPNPRDHLHLLGRIRDGLRLAGAGRLDDAAATLHEIVREQPGLVDVWMKLGDLHSRMGGHGDAVSAYREAVRRCPAPASDMLLAVGQAELRAGRLAEAESAAREAEAGSPTGAAGLRIRVALARGAHDEAQAQAEALVARVHGPAALVLLAEVQSRRGEPARSLETLTRAEERARELLTGPVYNLDFLRADASARLNRPADAEAAYRREIAAFPDHLQAYANLAVLAFVQHRPDEARKVLDGMLRANPGPSAYALGAKTLSVLGDRAGARAWRIRGPLSK